MATAITSKRLPLRSAPPPTEAMIAYCKEIGIQVPSQIEFGHFSVAHGGKPLKVAPANRTLPTACVIDFHEGYVLLLLPKAIPSRGPSISCGIESVWFIGLLSHTNPDNTTSPLFVVGRVGVGECLSIPDVEVDDLLVAFEKDPYEAMHLMSGVDESATKPVVPATPSLNEPTLLRATRHQSNMSTTASGKTESGHGSGRKCTALPPESLSFCKKCSSEFVPQTLSQHVGPSPSSPTTVSATLPPLLVRDETISSGFSHN